MSTQFTNRQWRLPNNENKAKQSNYSMDFSGTGDKIQTTLTPPLADNSRSISLWFYTSNSSSHNMCGYGAASQVSGHNGFDILTYTGNYVGIHLFGTAIIAGGTYNLNAWNHYVITYDGTTLQGYLNGVAVDSNSTEVVNTLSTNNFIIGEGVYTGFNGFSGKLDGVSIFDYALSSSQITTLYGSSSTGIGNPMTLSPKPVAFYQLGDKSAFNGANYLVPNIAAEEADGDIAASYSPYALNFDAASSDYIEIPDSSDLQLVNTDFSISFWINPSASGSYILMDKYGSGTGWGFYLQSGNLRFLAYPSGFQTVTTISQNVWTHILIVGDNSGDNLLCYKNGAEVYNSSYTLSISSNTTNLIIGSENGTSFFTNGKLSNLSIWNAALTSAQVTEIYSEGIPQNLLNHSAVSSLVSWWQLGSNSSFNSSLNQWTCIDEKGTNTGESSQTFNEDAIVDGVGSYANGLSSGMGGDEVIGDAPYSSSNALSVNMDVLDRVEDTPS